MLITTMEDGLNRSLSTEMELEAQATNNLFFKTKAQEELCIRQFRISIKIIIPKYCSV